MENWQLWVRHGFFLFLYFQKMLFFLCFEKLAVYIDAHLPNRYIQRRWKHNALLPSAKCKVSKTSGFVRHRIIIFSLSLFSHTHTRSHFLFQIYFFHTHIRICAYLQIHTNATNKPTCIDLDCYLMITVIRLQDTFKQVWFF